MSDLSRADLQRVLRTLRFAVEVVVVAVDRIPETLKNLERDHYDFEIYLDALLLNTRRLVEFFFDQPNAKKNRITAVSFIPSWDGDAVGPPARWLRGQWNDLSTRVAHITTRHTEETGLAWWAGHIRLAVVELARRFDDEVRHLGYEEWPELGWRLLEALPRWDEVLGPEGEIL